MSEEHQAILDFWIGDPFASGAELERRTRMWFRPDAKLDAEIASRFGALLGRPADEMEARWAGSARSRLALIILYDQFPRNICRGGAGAFAFDHRALALCQDGIERAQDRELEPLERMFFYMPLQHAESAESQQRAVARFEDLVEACLPQQRGFFELSREYAREHRDLIARFGRFPHRNRVLERDSTAEEIAYLEGGGKTFGQ